MRQDKEETTGRGRPAPRTRPRRAAELADAELLAVNEQLLVAGLRQQERAEAAQLQADALAHRATHDDLTGLPNRALFRERVAHAIQMAHRERTGLAVLLLDIDHFKEINERWGHAAGDVVLQQVAARLRGALREPDTAARIGGDEFAALLPAIGDLPSVVAAVRRIRRELERAFLVRSASISVTASVGIARYPDQGTDHDELLRHADVAMYTARRARRGVAIAGFAERRQGPAPDDGTSRAPGGAGQATANKPPEERARAGALHGRDLQAVNEELLIAGLREHELADQLGRQLAFTAAITGSLGEGVYATDQAGRITFANPAAEHLLGWTEAELAGRDAHELLHAQCAGGASLVSLERCPLLDAARASAAFRNDDAIFFRKDGTLLPVASSSAPIVAAGEVTGGVVAFRDMTEHNRGERARAALLAHEHAARQAAERSAGRVAGLLDASGALSAALTREQVAEVALEHGLALLGASGGLVALLTDGGAALEVVARRGYAAAAFEPDPRFPADLSYALSEAVRTGEPVFVGSMREWRARYPEGAAAGERLGLVATAALPLIVDGRAIGGLSVTYQDDCSVGEDERSLAMILARQCGQALERARLYDGEMAARARADALVTERSALIARLEGALAFRNQFLSVTTHELRTPLAGIKGYAQMLGRPRYRADDANVLEAGQLIVQEVEHMTRLLRELSDVARIEEDGAAFAPVPFDLSATLAETAAEIGVTAPDFALRLDERDRGLWVRGDRGRIRQVLINLLTNAVKYAGAKHAVDVAIRRDGAAAVVTVTDYGIGIPAAEQARVFDLNFRASNVPADRAESLGLGLFVSKAIVDQHAGSLRVRSGEGKGSTFTLSLPLLEGPGG